MFLWLLYAIMIPSCQFRHESFPKFQNESFQTEKRFYMEKQTSLLYIDLAVDIDWEYIYAHILRD